MCLTCTAQGNANAALVFAALIDGSTRAAEIANEAAQIDPDPHAAVHGEAVAEALRGALSDELNALAHKTAEANDLPLLHASGEVSVAVIAASIEALTDARRSLLRVIAALDRFGMDLAPKQPESQQIALSDKAATEIAQARLTHGGLDVQAVLRSIGAEPAESPAPGSAVPPNSRAQRRRRRAH